MPTSIMRDEVQRLIGEENALLIDVLPPAEYEDDHIAGAISIPLRQLDRDSTQALDPGRPLIVY
ncbi:MAG: rhodanese-like domain-containing protein [Chloroflexi bacterium]|nr:rhodanese-like domain-containing protein [Chloroflexota bacterium]